MSAPFSEDAYERQISYTKFFSKFIEKCIHINEEFINKVKDVLESGNELPRAFVGEDDYVVDECAILLKFGVQDACLGEEMFRKSALKFSKIRSLCSKERINICCIGSQSLLAVLGVCKMIEDSAHNIKFGNDGQTNVQIFIIDKSQNPEFSKFLVKIADQEYPSLKLKFDFHTVDITKNFWDTVDTRIKISHIVTMVRHLSSLTTEKDVSKITKHIPKSMKKNAVLFHMDQATTADVDKLKSLVDDMKCFTQINRPNKHPKTYILHKYARLYHHRAYEFLAPLNNYSFIKDRKPVTTSVWIKNPDKKIKPVERVKTTEKFINSRGAEDPDKFYRAKKSSNTKRNSTETFRLVGKFARMDMEKKYKDDSNRKIAKDEAVSRYATFVDW